jgi:hypothetical protein
MRFWLRSLLIMFATIVALFVGDGAAARLGIPFFIWLFALVCLANGALYLFLRCPKCGRWACRLPSGSGVVFPGFRCRYCDAEY